MTFFNMLSVGWVFTSTQQRPVVVDETDSLNRQPRRSRRASSSNGQDRYGYRHEHMFDRMQPYPSSSPRTRQSRRSEQRDLDTYYFMEVDPPLGFTTSQNRPTLADSLARTVENTSVTHASTSADKVIPDTQDFNSDKTPIYFYRREDPYFELTNFSPHRVEYNGAYYPTSEHLFQAHKFLPNHPELADRIRNLRSSREALIEATRLKRLQRPDWFDVNIGVMDDVLHAKFTQHIRLRWLLKETGDRELVEDSPVDAFWGVGADRTGRNELGKALMRLRAKL